MPFEHPYGILPPIIELLFTLISFAFCFIIYKKTREVYDLTKHQGIGYFSQAFLFFGLSYVMRFVFRLLFFWREGLEFLPRWITMPIFILPLGYFSTIGLFYLIFSSVSKKIKTRDFVFLAHGVAVLLSIVSFIARSPWFLLYFQSALIVIALVLNSVVSEKKISQAKVLYALIAFIWLIHLWVLGRPGPFEWDVVFGLITIGLFIAIYYKLSKWIK